MKKTGAFLISIFLFACSGNEETSKTLTNEVIHDTIIHNIVNPYVPLKGIDIEALKNEVDLTMDISKLSLSDIRILRNSFAARQGYCFMEADLRGIYNTTTWYAELMNNRYWEDEKGSISPIAYTKEEQLFINKLLEKENELKSNNFTKQGQNQIVNLNNVVNLFQMEELNSKLISMLARNGFAIVPNDNIQLFHVYEKNDYQQFPNFVTTDMYMQLFHMYFGYVLKQIEQEQFIPLLAEICNAMLTDMNEIARTNPDPSIQELALYNSTYYAIAYTALTGNKIKVASKYQSSYKKELKSIDAAKDDSEAQNKIMGSFKLEL